MDFFKMMAQLTCVPPVIMLVYDLINEFVGHNRFNLRPLREWWSSMWLSPSSMNATKHFIGQVASPGAADKAFGMPACLVLLFFPAFFFILYRVIFALKGGKAGGYKSRH